MVILFPPTLAQRGDALPSSTSPVSVDAARRIIAYNEAVFARYARAARRLPWRVAVRNQDIGHLSIFRTLVHILNVHEVWMLYIVQGRGRELDDLFRQSYRHPADWAGFRPYSDGVWEGLRSFAAQLTVRELSRPVKAPWMPGKYCVGDAVLQTTFEQAHHLGEIIGVLWQRNEEPPPMTWIDVNRGLGR